MHEISKQIDEFIESGKVYLNYHDSFKQGAEFGYTLSTERIQKLEKELERVKGLVEYEFRNKLARLQYDVDSINNHWEHFKNENKL